MNKSYVSYGISINDNIPEKFQATYPNVKQLLEVSKVIDPNDTIKIIERVVTDTELLTIKGKVLDQLWK